MKIKTSELTGNALDWAVAKCEHGDEVFIHLRDFLKINCKKGSPIPAIISTEYDQSAEYLEYSTNWAQSGPIIEKIAGFQLKMWLSSGAEDRCEAHIFNYTNDWISFGSTPLKAAMRCYVASKLGDEVEIPEELT